MNTDKSFDNSFDGLDIFGRDKVQLYTFLHIGAMKSKQLVLPFLVPLVISTQAKYDALFGNVVDKAWEIKQRMVQTKAVKKALKDFIVNARKVQTRTIDKVGINSPIYGELFSDGMKTYNVINHENAYKTIEILRKGTVKYTTELGIDMVTLIENSFTAFDTSIKAQLNLISNVRDNNPQYDANYVILKKQLNTNLHTICLQNDVNPKENYIFFTNSVLETPSHHKGKNFFGPWIIPIQVASQVDSLIAFALGQTIHIKNMCDVPIYYMGAVSGSELISPSCLMIMPGDEITITAEQLGCPQNKFLILGNKDATQLGVVKITLS